MKQDRFTKDIIKLAARLIGFKTFNSNYQDYEDCFDFVDKYLKHVLTIKVDKFLVNGFPSRLYYFRSKQQSRITLNGHLDVVFGTEQQFKAQKKSSKLFGRGSYDMKTACAVFIELFRQEPALMREKKVALMLVSDEELTGKNGTKYILDRGFKTDFCIVGEPTQLKITNEAKCSLYLRIEVLGKQAHSSRPWLGKNPSYDLVERLKKLFTLYKEPEKETWGITVSLVDIKTVSNSITTIPEKIEVKLNIRFPYRYSKTKIVSKMKKLFAPYKVSVTSCSDPIFTSGSNPFIRKFKKVLLGHNLPVDFRKGHGTADARFFTTKKIGNIGFGLKGGGAHSDHEWVDLDSVPIYYKIVKEFISKT